MTADPSLTQILHRIAARDDSVDEEQVQDLYWELRKIADRMMRRAAPGHTLQATALVNEAYLRLFGSEQPKVWSDRGHFFKVAATAMRTILVDHARRKHAKKRSAIRERVDLDEIVAQFSSDQGDLLDVESALQDLERRDPRAVRIAELSWFGGRSTAEIATIMDLSDRTIRRELDVATAFVRRQLEAADRRVDGEEDRS